MKIEFLKTAFILSVIVLASCEETDPQKRLGLLIEKRDKINEEILSLKKEIAKNDTTSKEKGLLVRVSKISSEPFSHFIDIQGAVKSDNDIMVSAKAAGTLLKVNVKEGQSVQKGQLLAEIDADIIYKGIAELKTGLELANTVYEKQKALWDQEIGSEIQFLQAKNNKESLEKKLASLYAQLDLYKIKATQSGVVDLVKNREGESVMPGMPVFRIVNNQSGLMKVLVEVAETYAGKVNIGDNVEVSLPDLKVVKNLKVSNIGEVINPLSRTFSIECKIIENIKGIKPNMLARVRIKDYYRPNAIVIPINAVQNSQEGEFVYVVAENKAKRKKIKVGKTYATSAEVVEGLEIGDLVVIQGYQDLTEGVSVVF
ncbi:MAG: efflux RND transporter periplasmic adaptor subunit [Cytophagales bacterium]